MLSGKKNAYYVYAMLCGDPNGKEIQNTQS